MLEICKTQKKVGKWEHFHEYYESKGDEVVKRYPAANKPALNQFRTISIREDSPDKQKGSHARPATAKGMLMKKLVDQNSTWATKKFYKERVDSARGDPPIQRPIGDLPAANKQFQG